MSPLWRFQRKFTGLELAPNPVPISSAQTSPVWLSSTSAGLLFSDTSLLLPHRQALNFLAGNEEKCGKMGLWEVVAGGGYVLRKRLPCRPSDFLRFLSSPSFSFRAG